MAGIGARLPRRIPSPEGSLAVNAERNEVKHVLADVDADDR